MNSLPSNWRKGAKVAQAKWTRALHERVTRIDRAPASERREAQLRLFGTDAETDAAIAALVKAFKLPGGPSDRLPSDVVTFEDQRWSVDVQRYKAPKGAARETIATILWSREGAPAPEGLKPCKKPPPLTPTAKTASWFERLTTRRSTRRLVTATRERRPKSDLFERRMFYRNGLARDEAIGQFTKAARRAGFEREGTAAGMNQTWVHPNGSRLLWRNDNSQLRLGCKISSPMLRLSLTVPHTD